MDSRDYDSQYDRIMSAKKNPYKVLDVPKKADEAEIKTKYRKLALLFHPDKACTDDQRARSPEAFRIIGLACALLLDPETRAEYDRTKHPASSASMGRNEMGGVVVKQSDPEAFFHSLFETHGKNDQGAEAFQNWMDLAEHGTGEAALGAVIFGKPDVAKQNPADTDDRIANKLKSLGLANHSAGLSIPGAPDAKRHFNASRSRTHHTDRHGNKTFQRNGESEELIDGQDEGHIKVTIRYKVVGYAPKPGSDGKAPAKLPGGLEHAPADDPRFKELEAQHDADMENRRYLRHDQRTYSDPDLQEKYGRRRITAPDDAGTIRTDTRSLAASRKTRQTSYDDAGTLASRRTARTSRESLAPSRASSRGGDRRDDDNQSMRTTRTTLTSQSSRSNKTSRDRDDARSMVNDSPRSKGDDSTVRSGSTLRTARSAGNLRSGKSSRWADAPPMPEDATMRTQRSVAPSYSYSRAPNDDLTMRSRQTTGTRRDDVSLMSSRSGRTRDARDAQGEGTMRSGRTGTSRI